MDRDKAKYYRDRNNGAIDGIIRDCGFENYYTIKFCKEVEKNPTMSILKLNALMVETYQLVHGK